MSKSLYLAEFRVPLDRETVLDGYAKRIARISRRYVWSPEVGGIVPRDPYKCDFSGFFQTTG